MAYESPEYQKLKHELWRLESIKQFVDLARDFERMRYMGSMTITCAPKSGIYDAPDEPITVMAHNHLKDEVIAAAVKFCIARAEAAAAAERQAFEIEKCVGV